MKHISDFAWPQQLEVLFLKSANKDVFANQVLSLEYFDTEVVEEVNFEIVFVGFSAWQVDSSVDFSLDKWLAVFRRCQVAMARVEPEHQLEGYLGHKRQEHSHCLAGCSDYIGFVAVEQLEQLFCPLLPGRTTVQDSKKHQRWQEHKSLLEPIFCFFLDQEQWVKHKFSGER